MGFPISSDGLTFFISSSGTISRVMSCVIIYPGQVSPPGSSDLPEARRAAASPLFGLASDGAYMDPPRYRGGGSLLHCLSTLTRALNPRGLFLLRYPWSRLRRTLSGILPCEARTFLSRGLSALTAAITYST